MATYSKIHTYLITKTREIVTIFLTDRPEEIAEKLGQVAKGASLTDFIIDEGNENSFTLRFENEQEM